MEAGIFLRALAGINLIGGDVVEAEPSWVACVGPNFAPEIPPISTMYDVVEDMNVQAGWSEMPALPLSFMTYIYPTFRRVALMEWVTQAANLRRGWMAIGDLRDPDYVARLADPDPANARAASAYRKAGFVDRGSKDAGDGAQARVMEFQR